MIHSGYCDDPTILDEDNLWRRIHPRWLKYDDNLGRVRPTSGAFQDPKDGSPMSVVLEKEHSNPNAYLRKFIDIDYTLASITAGLARECCQSVAREPQPDESAHSVVFGKKTERIRKRFAIEAEWVIPPYP